LHFNKLFPFNFAFNLPTPFNPFVNLALRIFLPS
jgi:hypothetical protein